MHDYVKNLAKVVRAAREEAHLSQAALAEQIGCDERTDVYKRQVRRLYHQTTPYRYPLPLFLPLLHIHPAIRSLICLLYTSDQYVNERSANWVRYGELAYMLGFSDCKELLLGSRHIPEMKDED